jgi:hypothetical protein
MSTETRLPRMMTIQQASDLTGITPAALLDAVQGGSLPGVHVGAPRQDGKRRAIWLHPRDVDAFSKTLERRAKFIGIEGDDQLCPQHVIQLGSRRAREMADLMIRATGAGCPCTWGDPCMFKGERPSPRELRRREEAGTGA